MLSRLVRTTTVAAVILLSNVATAVPILSAGSATVNVGDTFSIPIAISGAENLMAFQFDLGFDGAILAPISFTDSGSDFEAAATTSGGALTGITGFIFSGLLSGVADSTSGASAGLTGSGVLAEIQFKALATGNSGLILSNVFLDFLDARFPVMNGQVCVNGERRCDGVTQVPEPSTLALLSVGLGLLFSSKRFSRVAAKLVKG